MTSWITGQHEARKKRKRKDMGKPSTKLEPTKNTQENIVKKRKRQTQDDRCLSTGMRASIRYLISVVAS